MNAWVLNWWWLPFLVVAAIAFIWDWVREN